MEFVLTVCDENKILTVRVMKTNHFPNWIALRTKSIITFRVVCFFRVKRQKATAADGIKCKHESGLKLSITFLILYAYIKKSQVSAV